ncbi:MAG: exonuclease SbcCD subunit D [Acidimicrobiales bacterium]
MKLLHTADWHVGRTIRGRSRHDEHAAVLGEIVDIARREQVDLVAVVGDLFETASPPPEAEALVYRTLLALAGTGARVAVVAGNHDNARRLQAVAPVFESAGAIHLVTEPTRPADGGLWRFDAADGASVAVAMLPFVSQRGVVRARDLMDAAAFEHAQAYGDRMRLLIEALTAGFAADTVNVVLAHAFVFGGTLGGGERAAHFIDDYALSAQVFPETAGYVALGHVHRAQRIAGAAPIHYCGSPLALDFGDRADAKSVNLVTLEPGLPAAIETVELAGGRRLRTLTGSVAELAAAAGSGGAGSDADWLRVVVREPSRAGLADEVRDLLGDAVVEVRIEDTSAAGPVVARRRREGRSPSDLFGEFCNDRGIDDPRLVARFAALLDAEHDRSAVGAEAPEAIR